MDDNGRVLSKRRDEEGLRAVLGLGDDAALLVAAAGVVFLEELREVDLVLRFLGLFHGDERAIGGEGALRKRQEGDANCRAHRIEHKSLCRRPASLGRSSLTMKHLALGPAFLVLALALFERPETAWAQTVTSTGTTATRTATVAQTTTSTATVVQEQAPKRARRKITALAPHDYRNPAGS